MVIPSAPGLPLFWRTRFHAFPRFSRSHTSSISCFAEAGLSVVGFATNGSQSYLPLLIVRAFGHRFRLGLSVAPPFGCGVPHYPCRRLGLLCLLLTPAPRSRG